MKNGAQYISPLVFYAPALGQSCNEMSCQAERIVLQRGQQEEYDPPPVGAAAGCDLLILILILKNKIKRSQPSAAPTRGESYLVFK
ncbi:hypothetical protein EMIT0215P_20450 [Pseudomonas serboccidentalis]